jgi:hypothetical protein
VRLIGILIWYDEQPEWLAAAVASFARAGGEHLIALDGAFACYPDGVRHPRSGTEQHAAVREVCDAHNLGLTLYSPAEAYVGNELEKRSLGFALADLVATPYEDWYLILDADEVVTTSLGLRETLEQTSCDVGEVVFWERNKIHDPSLGRVRCLFRAIPGIQVKGNHYTYITPDGRKLWGDGHLEDSVITPAEIEHRTWIRPKHRQQNQLDYLAQRDRVATEYPLPDLRSA